MEMEAVTAKSLLGLSVVVTVALAVWRLVQLVVCLLSYLEVVLVVTKLLVMQRLNCCRLLCSNGGNRYICGQQSTG